MNPDSTSNSIPNDDDVAKGRQNPAPDSPPTENIKTADETPPVRTQGHMADGSGVRGGYGDSDQTNGMEGGTDENKPASESE